MQDNQMSVGAELRQVFFRRVRWMADNAEEVWRHLSGKVGNELESDVLAASRTATAGDLSGALGELLITASDFAGEKQKITGDDGRDQERASAKSPGISSIYLPNADDLISPIYRADDLARGQAIINFAAWQIEVSDWFQEFRQSFLGGSILSREATLGFLLSPAIRLLPKSAFAKYGERIHTHDATLLDEGRIVDGERLRRLYSLQFSTSGKKVNINYDEEAMRSYDDQPVFQPKIGEFFANYTNATYYPGTAFDEIMQAAEHTAACLLGCSHRAALAFLLNGELPDVRLIDAGWLHSMNSGGDLVPLSLAGIPRREAPNYSPSHITMTIPIWLSADVVEQAFRLLQQKALHGRENRQSKERNLYLLIYVLSEKRRMGIADEGTEEQRRKIWKSWNDLCGKSDLQIPGCGPDWQISDFAQFTRTCRRVDEHLFPSFFYG